MQEGYRSDKRPTNTTWFDRPSYSSAAHYPSMVGTGAQRSNGESEDGHLRGDL